MENNEKKSIGILGGMGPLATADLMLKIIQHTQAEKDQDHIRIYIDNNPRIPDRTGAILRGGENPVPEMSRSLNNLLNCGADCIIMPCNTAHYFHDQLQALSHKPILHMLKLTARTCRETFPGKSVAVLATSGTLQSGIYHRVLEEAGVPYLIPDDKQQQILMHLIYDVVKAGLPLEPEKESWSALLEDLRKKGADYFILGCTELPLLAQNLAVPGPFVDPTDELAKGAVRFCGYALKD